MKIQIRKVNGVPMGRPVNPYSQLKFFCDSWTGDAYPKCSNLTDCDCEKFSQFEQSVTEHEAPGCEEGEAEGQLVTREWVLGGWLITDEPYTGKYNTKQIWRIVSTPEKVEVKEVDPEQQLLDQPKEQVIERQFKNNCDYGFKQPNVNKFIRMAFESGFENGMNYQKYSNHPETKKLPSPPTH